MRHPETTIRCRACGTTKPASAFGWSKTKHRPTRTCKACWGRVSTQLRHNASESTEELILYYAHIRSMMEDLNKAHAEAVEKGLPLERQIGDVWVSEMTEDVYRSIVKALVIKAEGGDVRAAELLLTERHRRAGEPTPGSVEESFEGLFLLDPLAPGLDSE